MKMVVAIVQDKDSSRLLPKLVKEGFSATRLSSTGGFLRSGNTTLLMGVEENQIEQLVAIIKETCRQRNEILTQAQPIISPVDAPVPFPIEVPVGGATIFILNVENFIKV